MTMPKDHHQVPPAFVEMFRELVVAFQPRHVERDAAAVYWATLGLEYTLPVLRESARALMRSSKFFPTLAEWFSAARETSHTRILEDRADETEPCEWCGDRGLVRVMYRSGDAWDIAICTCMAARFFRAAGPNYVRIAYGLTPDQRVANIDDFDDDDKIADDPSITAEPGVFVYAFVAGEFLKIGFSTNLARRYRDLCGARGRDGSFVGRARCGTVRDARLLERWLQHRYGNQLLDGEWFSAAPTVVTELRELLRDPAAVGRALQEARLARTKVAPSAAQQNARVIGAVALELLKTLTVSGPPEAIAPQLIQRCAELKIACDEHVAIRALRSAAWRMGIAW